MRAVRPARRVNLLVTMDIVRAASALAGFDVEDPCAAEQRTRPFKLYAAV